MKLPLPFSTYKLNATQASAKRLANCYAEPVQQGEKGAYILKRDPGILAWGTVGDGPGRGLHVSNGVLYAVSGNSMYSVDSAGDGTELGDVNGVNPVSMSSNDTSVVVANGSEGYYYNGSFGQITDADFTARSPLKVAFLDNWLVFIDGGTGEYFSADLGSATSFDALNFATAESHPDSLIGLLSNQLQLVLFGTDSTELAYNSGASGFPFERLPSGGSIQLGCASGDSCVNADNSFLWLANDLTVRRLNGSTPTRVSTHAIEEQIAALSRKDDAIGLTFTLSGHIYYVLTFPTSARTFIYDITADSWHDKESYLVGRWRPVSYAYCYGKHLVQDYETGRIGELRPDVYGEWDDPQIMSWTYPTIYAEGRTAVHDSLELITQRGVGLITGQGSDPQVLLEYSDDGGMTWIAMQGESIGAIGQYKWRTKWNRLGASDNRAYRCSISDPVPVTVIDTQAQVRGGRL